ncbi:hypothetical protein [Paenibacillus polymyxa]|uniref:hypothetical protein n=1 Tax=Paenibacillus polymyxa TaxID=1406 RepID=UPI00234980B9|nr:hypothetical protein [Paenibacillus polymyxa]WCM59798.1 hypothetical protein OYT09_17505 [Paenibacillus polymyxa]
MGTNVFYVPPVNLMGSGCLLADNAMKDVCAPGNPFQPTQEEVITLFQKILWSD